MRRIVSFFLCLLLLPVPARAAEEKCVALTFDGGPAGKYTRQVLDGLYDRGIRATFVLVGSQMEQHPDLSRRIPEEGHEIAIRGYSRESMRPMSRRAIAEEIARTQALLPPGCAVRFLRPMGDVCTDGVRQVAEARNLALLSWSADPRDWSDGNSGSLKAAAVRHVRDGDILLLRDNTAGNAAEALAIADALMEAGFDFLTVSDLAKRRNTRIIPGRIYDRF